jgi:hypothetical protein
MEYIKNSPAWQEFQGKHKVKYLTKRHLDRETKRLLDRETKRLFSTGTLTGTGFQREQVPPQTTFLKGRQYEKRQTCKGTPKYIDVSKAID